MLDPPQNVENQLNQPNLLPPKNLSNPTQKLPLPPMLQRRSTRPSTQATAKHFFRNRTHRTRNHPTPPGLAAANQVHEEGIPTQRGVKITIDPNKVFQAACAHENSTVATPEYDNLSAYYTSEDTAKELLKREIARLIAIVENPEGELRLSDQKFLKEGSRDGYIELSSLSKMITQALSTAILDIIDLTRSGNEDNSRFKRSGLECFPTLWPPKITIPTIAHQKPPHLPQTRPVDR